MTTKYQPLVKALDQRKSLRIQMTFAEIEKSLGFSLPPVARKFRSWWSNNPNNSVMTRVWLEAGYKSSEVDVANERLTFVREHQQKSA